MAEIDPAAYRTAADPFDTMPPYVPGQSDHDALVAAFEHEMRKRFATGPATSWDDWAQVSAKIAIRTLRHQREGRTGGHEAEFGERSPWCAVCQEPIHLDDNDRWIHS